MSGQQYDVIVVGAGPVGSYIAHELSSSGYDVAVFEEKSAPGLDVCCTGIISTECFQSLGPGTDVILTEVNSARFFSPSGRCLRLQTENVQAYVVNRLLLDEALASKAQSRGARYFFSSPVIDIIPGQDSIQAETLRSGARETFSARAVVLANGFKPKLPRKLGLGKIKSFLVGAQAEIEAKNVDELEVYFGQEIAPGSFAWLVPTSTNKAYIGLLAKSQAKLHLQKFLNNIFDQGRITSREVEIRQKAVPVGTLARSYGDRVLVIGDAAGQVKPTTGGGIYFGHLGAKIAAEVLDEALSSDNLSATQLSRYQKQWKAKMGKELSLGYRARQAYIKLSDRQIEGIFSALDSSGMAEALLKSGDFSFDWHSRLILAGLKRSSTYPLLKIKELVSREATL
ncbi:MAG TPA: NAD(P)/FAD-dependent oxidoreductase [Dehalococcoidia bacterium]|nr:NAD(P)/FAD-dependent oxidoreductase [Dehalococcoidia bacterium]